MQQMNLDKIDLQQDYLIEGTIDNVWGSPTNLEFDLYDNQQNVKHFSIDYSSDTYILMSTLLLGGYSGKNLGQTRVIYNNEEDNIILLLGCIKEDFKKLENSKEIERSKDKNALALELKGKIVGIFYEKDVRTGTHNLKVYAKIESVLVMFIAIYANPINLYSRMNAAVNYFISEDEVLLICNIMNYSGTQSYELLDVKKSV